VAQHGARVVLASSAPRRSSRSSDRS
jgi:hypothetical protein